MEMRQLELKRRIALVINIEFILLKKLKVVVAIKYFPFLPWVNTAERYYNDSTWRRHRFCEQLICGLCMITRQLTQFHSPIQLCMRYETVVVTLHTLTIFGSLLVTNHVSNASLEFLAFLFRFGQ